MSNSVFPKSNAKFSMAREPKTSTSYFHLSVPVGFLPTNTLEFANLPFNRSQVHTDIVKKSLPIMAQVRSVATGSVTRGEWVTLTEGSSVVVLAAGIVAGL